MHIRGSERRACAISLFRCVEPEKMPMRFHEFLPQRDERSLTNIILPVDVLNGIGSFVDNSAVMPML
jgi:hypothetical protein